jgi:hypothetical protein
MKIQNKALRVTLKIGGWILAVAAAIYILAIIVFNVFNYLS